MIDFVCFYEINFVEFVECFGFVQIFRLVIYIAIWVYLPKF